MALEWNSTLAVGVDEIDAQHREIFARASRLVAAVERGDAGEVGSLLDFLQEYVAAHFALEERVMTAARYPELANHHAEHRAFAEELGRIAADHALSGSSEALVAALERHVGGWLRSHIGLTDVALGRYLARAGGRAGTRGTAP
jgi:hemerythrin